MRRRPRSCRELSLRDRAVRSAAATVITVHVIRIAFEMGGCALAMVMMGVGEMGVGFLAVMGVGEMGVCFLAMMRAGDWSFLL